MPSSIRHAAGVLALLFCSAPAWAQATTDRVFGRVGPDRPVVEIPAGEVGGVRPEPGSPAAGWEVRSEAHVQPAEPVVNPAEPEPVPAEPAAAATVPASAESALVEPVLSGVPVAPRPDSATEASPRIPVLVPDTQPLGASQAEQQATLGAASRSEPGTFSWIARTGAALALVLGLILALAWLYERATRAKRGVALGGAGGRSPSGVLEVLGRYPIGPRQSLLLLKFDRRVLLLSQTAPRGGPVVTSTLCELNDPEDVASVLVKVRDASGESMNRAFAAAMDHADRHAGALAGQAPAAPIAPPRASVIEARPLAADYDPEDLRRTVGGSESERAQLWEDLGTDRGGRDPIGSLRRRLESMRGGAAG